MLASLGHNCCPSCGNKSRFQRESLYQGVFYPGNDTKYQNIKFDQPLPVVDKPALELIDLADEEDEVVASTIQEDETDKLMEVVKKREDEADKEDRVEEERAVLISPEVEMIEDKDLDDITESNNFVDIDKEMCKEETVSIKFGFSGSNRDSGFSSLDSSEVEELELEVEDDDHEMEGNEKVDESTEDILARYRSVNMDFSVALPSEIQSIEFVRDSSITVDLADNLLSAVIDDPKNLEGEEKNVEEKSDKAENSVIELDTTFDDSAIDVDTPEKESEGALSEMDEFTKKLATLNRKHRNKAVEDFGGENDERGRKPRKMLETVTGLQQYRSENEGKREEQEIISSESFLSQLETEEEKEESASNERLKDAAEKEKAEKSVKKKVKRVSWQDETVLMASHEKSERERKDQPRKRERSRSQDSQDEEENSKDDSKRKSREKNEKKRKGDYKKMRKRDRSCSQDSQEEDEENEEEEMTPEERKAYEERVKENLRKIKKRPVHERKIVHGRNNVSNKISKIKSFSLFLLLKHWHFRPLGGRMWKNTQIVWTKLWRSFTRKRFWNQRHFSRMKKISSCFGIAF